MPAQRDNTRLLPHGLGVTHTHTHTIRFPQEQPERACVPQAVRGRWCTWPRSWRAHSQADIEGRTPYREVEAISASRKGLGLLGSGSAEDWPVLVVLADQTCVLGIDVSTRWRDAAHVARNGSRAVASLVQARPCDMESRRRILSIMRVRSAVPGPLKLRISRFAALQPLALGSLSHATSNRLLDEGCQQQPSRMVRHRSWSSSRIFAISVSTAKSKQ